MLYMLDTNIISYLLEGNEKIRKHLFSILSGNEIELPEIVYYEIERGLLLNNAKNKQTNVNEFCRLFPIRYMTKDALFCASQIYADLCKKGKIIEDADILIGACAISNNAIIVTNNEEHLGRIEGLKIENWTK